MNLQDVVLSEGRQSDRTDTLSSHFFEKPTVIKVIKLNSKSCLSGTMVFKKWEIIVQWVYGCDCVKKCSRTKLCKMVHIAENTFV